MKTVLKYALLICFSMFCKLANSQDTIKYKLYFYPVKYEEPKNVLVIHNCGINCNYDSAKISIKGDTLFLIRTLLKQYDLRNKQYESLKKVAWNINSKQFYKYLKEYEALRDSIIK